MQYNCEPCEYTTGDKSNYARHLKTKKHLKTTEKMTNLICQFCKKLFSNKSSLSRHIKFSCKGIFSEQLEMSKKVHVCNNCGIKFNSVIDFSIHNKICDTINEKIKQKEIEIENKYLKDQVCELKEYIKSGNNTPVYNISIKKYVQQNYSDAPPLRQLDDYSIMEFHNDELINNLVYYYNHGNLHQYLGDFLVKYYKKDDSSQQSIWNSDVSRMTYIIKELLANKQSFWNHDYKGVKTKEYIIMPLLKYVRKYITDYISNFMLDVNNLSTKDYQNIVEKQLSIAHIIQAIDNNLSDDIVKYIAPHFHLIKYNKNENNLLMNYE